MVELEDSGWAWIRRYKDLGFCLTAVEGVSAPAMLAGFGIATDSLVLRTLVQADAEWGTDLPVVRAGEVGGWGFTFELFGPANSDGAPARRLSVGTRAVSVWYVAKGFGYFGYLEDGVMACQFEPLFPKRREGSDPDQFASLMRQVGLAPDGGPDLARVDPTTAALDMVTLAFGLRLSADQVKGPLLTGVVRPDLLGAGRARAPAGG